MRKLNKQEFVIMMLKVQEERKKEKQMEHRINKTVQFVEEREEYIDSKSEEWKLEGYNTWFKMQELRKRAEIK